MSEQVPEGWSQNNSRRDDFTESRSSTSERLDL